MTKTNCLTGYKLVKIKFGFASFEYGSTVYGEDFTCTKGADSVGFFQLLGGRSGVTSGEPSSTVYKDNSIAPIVTNSSRNSDGSDLKSQEIYYKLNISEQ